MADVDETPGEESVRFAVLLSVLRDVVPEVEAWWQDDQDDELEPLTLGYSWWLIQSHLFDSDSSPLLHDDVWPRVLRVVEVSLQVETLLWADGRDDDAVTVDAFAAAGVLCDVTRSRQSLEALLRWMGPESVVCAREEVAAHVTSRGFDVADVDWGAATSNFVGLDIDSSALVPLRGG